VAGKLANEPASNRAWLKTETAGLPDWRCRRRAV